MKNKKRKEKGTKTKKHNKTSEDRTKHCKEPEAKNIEKKQ